MIEDSFKHVSRKAANCNPLTFTLTWLFSCKFAGYFQKTFSLEHLWRAASGLSPIREYNF